MIPLNDNPKFKEQFKDTHRKILINATNLKYAALLIIDKGRLEVESIPNKPEENIRKKNVGWDGFIEMDTQTFLAIALNRLSLLGVAKMWLTRRIKMRGIRKLLILLKMFRFLTNYNE